MSAEKTDKRAKQILARDYPVVVTRDQDTGVFIAEVRDWPGCLAHGVTIEEAFRSLEDAKATWVVDCLERDLPIPQPSVIEQRSGKFQLRVPRSLHRTLAEAAEAEGVSLNTYVVSALSEHVGGWMALQGISAVRDEMLTMLDELRRTATNVAPGFTTLPAGRKIRWHGARLWSVTSEHRADTRLFGPENELVGSSEALGSNIIGREEGHVAS